jgi:hypothetical protein
MRALKSTHAITVRKEKRSGESNEGKHKRNKHDISRDISRDSKREKESKAEKKRQIKLEKTQTMKLNTVISQLEKDHLEEPDIDGG